MVLIMEDIMTTDALKQLRLFNQFLTHPDKRLTVVQALNGLQAQYLSNALHAMRLRSVDFDADHAANGLVKSWTLRGTMHMPRPICRCFCTAAAAITAATGQFRPSGTSARTGR